VISGLFELSRQRDFDPFQLKAGIIGFGNVGSRLFAKLETLGIDCLLCDPPLQQNRVSQRNFTSLDTILRECSFISLHVPLTHGGEHPTFHLLDAERLRMLADGCVLINAARGEVVDNHALLELLGERGDLRVFLDTWENEPLVSRELMQRVDLATPHIAGYSVEGRLRGTQMVLDAACAHFGLPANWHMSQQLPPTRPIDCDASTSAVAFWQDLFRRHCDIRRDHDAFVGGHALDDNAFATHFDGLRKVYPDRLEYPRFSLNVDATAPAAKQLAQLGFQLAQ
jgi:erythronate-4-phosphate dehydrogenase